MARPRRFEICPLGGAGVGGMLQTYLWFHLLAGPRRFGELQRLIPQASRQMFNSDFVIPRTLRTESCSRFNL